MSQATINLRIEMNDGESHQLTVIDFRVRDGETAKEVYERARQYAASLFKRNHVR